MKPSNPRIRIAIDGPAASGKSTTARLVAHELGFLYVDTGAMYRAVTLAVLEQGIDPGNTAAITRLAEKLEINQTSHGTETHTHLNGRDVSADIRMPAVTAVISQISSDPVLRRIMVEKQRGMAARGNVVMEGRDIGTVVIPDAEIKIFMKATLGERARRRLLELNGSGVKTTLKEIKADISRRDALDASRVNSPLKAASDAIILDTSLMSIDEQVKFVIELVNLRVSFGRLD